MDFSTDYNLHCNAGNVKGFLINSSLLQLNAINVIRKKGMFLKLNDKLKYTASLREQYPTDTLEQIASKTEGKNKISKSGLKHRLDKLIEIAQNLQSE